MATEDQEPEKLSELLGFSTTPAGEAPAGGYGPFFNRVVDGGYWRNLSPAAKAIYPVLVRFAQSQKDLKVRIGYRSLIRHSGTSLSTVKRAVRELRNEHLINRIRKGGRDSAGRRIVAVYQLMVPPPAY